MIFRFLDWFIDYWVMLNYVFYKFYERFWKESDPQIRGLIYAPGWVLFNFMEIIFLLDDLFDCQILSTIMENNKYLCIMPYFPVLLLNYLFLYRKDRWKDIFKQIDKERDSEEIKKRYRNTVIYIWASIAILTIHVIITSLRRHFGLL
ncbi:MAG: hypothetical protein E7077_03745 [Bacteroidales bacterium]|jgi:hypothetical protein|nr:hypothetical protein [Bacteroidales bacterium]